MFGLSTVEWIFILLFQIILILCCFIGFFIWKINALKKQPVVNATGKLKDAAQDDSRISYLESEIDKTRKYLDNMSENAANKDVSGLKLRHEILKFELEHLKEHRTEVSPKAESDWSELNRKFYTILSVNRSATEMGYLAQLNNDNLDIDPSSEMLFAQQGKTIEFLKSFIDELISNLDTLDPESPSSQLVKELNKETKKLDQINSELEHCVSILEDQNSFLRNQILALLKVGTS